MELSSLGRPGEATFPCYSMVAFAEDSGSRAEMIALDDAQRQPG